MRSEDALREILKNSQGAYTATTANFLLDLNVFATPTTPTENPQVL